MDNVDSQLNGELSNQYNSLDSLNKVQSLRNSQNVPNTNVGARDAKRCL